MADRSVTVTLRASIGQYVSSVRSASSETEKFAKGGAKSLAEHSRQVERVGKGFLVAGGLIAVGIGAAVKSYMEFDKQMSNVRAVSGASASEMKSLAAAATEAGARTKFSASEAAQATAELAKVGLSTGDILGGALNGALDLAAAGNLQLADAAMYAGQTMKIFKLEGQDVPRIADALANGANKSAADITDLSQALQQSGLQAAQMGLGLEDTVGTLSLFADNALMGSDAGTSLKTMLARLNPTTKAASNAMDDLGLKFYDADGKFIGVEASAQLLQNRLKGLSVEQRQSALNTIFGSDAIRAATVLYDAGAAGVHKYIAGVSEQGAAARLAAIQMDNLSGDVEQLQGAFETALIQSGSGANNMLRGIVQSVSGAVDWFSQLPGPVQAGATALAAVAGAGSLTVGAFLTLVPKIAEARKALQSLGGVSAVLTPVGIALAAATVAVGFFVKGQMDAQQRAQEFRATLDQQTGALTDNSRAFIANALQQRTFAEDGNGAAMSVLGLAKSLGVSTKSVVDASLGQSDALSQITLAAQQADTAYQGMIAANLAGQPVDLAAYDAAEQRSQGLNNLLGIIRETTGEYGTQIDANKEVTEAVKGTGNASVDAAKKTADLASKQAQATAAAQAQAKAIDDLRKSVQDYGSATSDMLGKQIAYEDAIDKSAEAVKKNGRNLRLTTEAGRSNMKSLLDQADAAKAQAVQMNVSGKSIGAVRDFMVGKGGKGGARQGFIDMAVAMGKSKKDAGILATQLGLTTGNVNNLAAATRKVKSPPPVKVSVPTAKPKADIDDIRAYMGTIRDRQVNVSISVLGLAALRAASSLTMGLSGVAATVIAATQRAAGGAIYGAGTGTSDSIPAWLSNGEHVLTAAEVERAGGHAAIYRMRRAINTQGLKFAEGGAVGHYASGGAVRAPLDTFYGDYVSSLGERVTAADLVENRKAIAASTDKLRLAEMKLAEDRSKKKRNARQIAADEIAVAKAHDAVTAATKKATTAQSRYKAQQLTPLAKFQRGLSGGVKNTGAFIANIEKLAGRGYVGLAQQLAEMSNEDAEKIAAQAATASVKTLNGLNYNVARASLQQNKLDHIDTIAAILGQVRSKNLTARQMASATGIDVMEILDAVALVKGDLSKNKNATKLLADLAKRSSGQLFSTGGFVSGPGTATSDSVPAWLSDGEYVVKAAAVQRYGVDFFHRLNGMRFAEGGQVGAYRAPAPSFDYGRFADAVGPRGGDTFNAYGSDAEQAVQRVMRQKEFREMARLP